MPRLTASERARLPSWAFALPERREFPLTDKHFASSTTTIYSTLCGPLERHHDDRQP